jgi:hypothetical protein
MEDAFVTMQNIKYLMATPTYCVAEETILVKSVFQRIKEIPKSIGRNKANIVAVIIWSMIIGGFVIAEYWLFFKYGPDRVKFEFMQSRGGIYPPFETWAGASLTVVDLLAISLAALFFGAFISEVEKVFYGIVSAVIISSSVATGYIAYHIWTVLGWGSVLSTTSAGWSWAIYWGFLNTFRAIFPMPIAFTLLFGILGAFLRSSIDSS